MAKLSTAQRIVIGFAIAPLALMGIALYALNDLATLKQQSEVIVKQDWPKIEPMMVIATGVRDNAMMQKLVNEHEMGELFKVIALAPAASAQGWVPLGFAVGDRTHRL